MIRCHLRTDASGCRVDKHRRSVGDVNNAPLHGELEEMEEMEVERERKETWAGPKQRGRATETAAKLPLGARRFFEKHL